jgi:hypothetical protein
MKRMEEDESGGRDEAAYGEADGTVDNTVGAATNDGNGDEQTGHD